MVRLRIVVWNCRGRLGQKSRLLSGLSPDLAIVPECECPEVLLRRAIDLDGCGFAWDGTRPDRGLAVLAFGAWRVEVDPMHRMCAGSTLPVRVSGPAELRLVAAWALPPWTQRRGQPPSEPLADGIERLRPLFRKTPAILAGDFNRSLVTRLADGRLGPSPLARRLADLGLVSAYHHAHGVPVGGERSPTFFRLRRFPSPHHLDHVLVDSSSAAGIHRVELRQGPRWMVWSDHAPLVVDLGLAAVLDPCPVDVAAPLRERNRAQWNRGLR